MGFQMPFGDGVEKMMIFGTGECSVLMSFSLFCGIRHLRAIRCFFFQFLPFFFCLVLNEQILKCSL